MLVNGKPVVPMVGEFLWVRQYPSRLTWNAAEGRYDAEQYGVVVRYLGAYQIDGASGIRTGLAEEWDGYRSHLQMPVKHTRLATPEEAASWHASRASGRYPPPAPPAVPAPAKPTSAAPAHEGVKERR